MIVVTGKGKVIKNIDRVGVVAEFQKAQKSGDRFCSVTGAISAGYDPVEIMREAGYTIGATTEEAEISLNTAAATLGRKGGASRSKAKQAASRENWKKGGRPRDKKKPA